MKNSSEHDFNKAIGRAFAVVRASVYALANRVTASNGMNSIWKAAISSGLPAPSRTVQSRTNEV
jgi:hypothetical protein